MKSRKEWKILGRLRKFPPDFVFEVIANFLISSFLERQRRALTCQTPSLELSDLVYCNTWIVWTPYYEVYCMNFIMMLIEKSGQFIANERRVINVKLNVINFERDKLKSEKSGSKNFENDEFEMFELPFHVLGMTTKILLYVEKKFDSKK